MHIQFFVVVLCFFLAVSRFKRNARMAFLSFCDVSIDATSSRLESIEVVLDWEV